MSGVDGTIALTVLLAAVTQGVIGFGYGLLVMAVLPRFLPLQAAVGTVAVSGLFVSGVLLWRYRAEVRWDVVARLCAGGALGLPLGVWALRDLDPAPAIRALGAVLAGHAAWALAAPLRRTAARRRVPAAAWGYPAGFFGGLLGGAFAAGGPPVVVYAASQGWSSETFRGVLQGFFTAFTLVHLAALGLTGLLAQEVIVRAGTLVPLVALGVWVGARYGDRLGRERFRVVVLVALFLTGASYLATGA